MTDLALVMPMAGRGSRFLKDGIREPKPLVDLFGRPFFWWAAESVLRTAPVDQMVFVVLDEHVAEFAIDRRIGEHYPSAQIVGIPDVTSGAAETARIGIEAVTGSGPLFVNDCDHAFHCPGLAGAARKLGEGASGSLMCFRSDDPAYSYVKLDPAGTVVGTVEKEVASPFAIAGCYGFSSRERFLGLYDEYQHRCTYAELFVSGLFNLMAEQGETVVKVEVERHLSFGTPAERDRVLAAGLGELAQWR